MKHFELVKYKGRWAIFDKISKVYYFGTKKNLMKRLESLNETH